MKPPNLLETLFKNKNKKSDPKFSIEKKGPVVFLKTVYTSSKMRVLKEVVKVAKIFA